MQPHKNSAVVLKTCNSSNIEHLSICTVKLQHKSNVVRCCLFVAPGNGPVPFGMPDIEVLGILKITCEVISSHQTGSKFEYQILWPTGLPKYKTHTVEDHRTDNRDAKKGNVNILDCFRSSANIRAEREASSIITQRFYNELSMFSQALDVLKAPSS